SFHYSFIFYAPLLFVTGENNNKWLKRFVIISMSFSLIIILNGNEIPFQSFIIDYTGNRVIEDYLTTQTNFGFLIPTILHGSSIFLAYWFREIIKKKHIDVDINILSNDLNNHK